MNSISNPLMKTKALLYLVTALMAVTVHATPLNVSGRAQTSGTADTLQGYPASYFATSTQGAKADSALQSGSSAIPGVTVTSSNGVLLVSGTPSAINAAVQSALDSKATSAQGAKADSALQSGSSTVAGVTVTSSNGVLLVSGIPSAINAATNAAIAAAIDAQITVMNVACPQWAYLSGSGGAATSYAGMAGATISTGTSANSFGIVQFLDHGNSTNQFGWGHRWMYPWTIIYRFSTSQNQLTANNAMWFRIVNGPAAVIATAPAFNLNVQGAEVRLTGNGTDNGVIATLSTTGTSGTTPTAYSPALSLSGWQWYWAYIKITSDGTNISAYFRGAPYFPAWTLIGTLPSPTGYPPNYLNVMMGVQTSGSAGAIVNAKIDMFKFIDGNF